MDNDHNQPETKTPSANTDKAAAHLKDIVFPDIELEESDDDPRRLHLSVDDEGGGDLDDVEPVERMTREAFRDLFSFSFSVPAMLPNMSDFEPLAVTEKERPSVDKGADGLYNILDRHFPKVLNLSDEMGDYLALGTVLFGKAMIVREVLNARREAATVEHVTPQSGSIETGGGGEPQPPKFFTDGGAHGRE